MLRLEPIKIRRSEGAAPLFPRLPAARRSDQIWGMILGLLRRPAPYYGVRIRNAERIAGLALTFSDSNH